MTTTPQAGRPDAARVQAMFSEIAGRYDAANDFLSLGVHHLWRRKLVKLSQAKSGDKVLDCATGTGDLALEFKKTVGTAGEVIGTDFCAPMLEHAPAKAEKLGLKVKFELADVTKLSYLDASFDIASISFGIRNVQDTAKGISELARVVKPGGRVMILEFGQIKGVVFGGLYRVYSKHILPRLGGLVTGKQEAYRYLESSSNLFPSGEDFANLMRSSANFSKVEYWPVSFGIAYIYRGTKA